MNEFPQASTSENDAVPAPVENIDADDTDDDETPDAPETAEPAEATNPLNTIEKIYFPPDAISEAVELLGHLMEIVPKGDLKLNFDPNDADTPFPENWGIQVFPVAKRVKGVGNEIAKVVFAKVPTVEAVTTHPDGPAFIENAILGEFQAKLGNAVRPRENGSIPETMPETLTDFITRRAKGESLKAFNEIADDMVSALRQIGLKRMNKKILQLCLKSESYADSQYPKVPQAEWEKVVAVCMKKAEAKGLSTDIFEHWLTTRNESDLASDITFNADSLSDLI